MYDLPPVTTKWSRLETAAGLMSFAGIGGRSSSHFVPDVLSDKERRLLVAFSLLQPPIAVNWSQTTAIEKSRYRDGSSSVHLSSDAENVNTRSCQETYTEPRWTTAAPQCDVMPFTGGCAPCLHLKRSRDSCSGDSRV